MTKGIRWIFFLLAFKENLKGVMLADYSMGSGLCYSTILTSQTHSGAHNECGELETGGELMWFWSYNQWAVVQGMHNINGTDHWWIHLDKGTCGSANDYCWADRTLISDGGDPWGHLPGDSPYTVDTGNGCVAFSNDVKASGEDRLWFVEAPCNNAYFYVCRRPCNDVYGFLTVSTTEGAVASWDMSTDITFTFTSTRPGENRRVWWYINGQLEQTGSSTTYLLESTLARGVTTIQVCLTTEYGDYIKSDSYSLYRTEPPLTFINPDQNLYKIGDSVTLDCISPGTIVTSVSINWYKSNTDPELGAVDWVHQSSFPSFTMVSWDERTGWMVCTYVTDGNESPHSATRTLTFVETAVITMSPNNTIHGINDTVLFNCTYPGDLVNVTNYQWYEVDSDPTFLPQPWTPAFSGQSFNVTSSEERSLWLACTYWTEAGEAPMSSHITLTFLETPFITTSSNKTIFRILDTVLADCVYPGNFATVTSVKWYECYSVDWAHVSSNDTLSVTETVATTVWFSCTFVSYFGESPLSAYIRLEFSEVPLQPVITSATSVTNANSLAYMTCNPTSTELGNTNYQWYADGASKLDPSATVGFTSLPGNVSYTCVASDDRGVSSESEPWIVTYLMSNFLSYEIEGHCYTIIGTLNDYDWQTITCQISDYMTVWWPWDQIEFDDLGHKMTSWLPEDKDYWIRVKGPEYVWQNGSSIDSTNWVMTPSDPSRCVRLKYNISSDSFFLKERPCTSDRGVICKKPCSGGQYNVPVVLPSNDILFLGENATLQCVLQPVGSGAEIQWVTNGVIDAGGPGDEYKETETHHTPHRDVFRCMAVYPDGRWYISDEEVIITLDPPELISYPHNHNTFSTETPVTLTCHTNAPGNHTYFWQRSIFPQGPSSLTSLSETGPTLVIDTTTPYQATFYCSYTMEDIGTSIIENIDITITQGPPMPTILYTPHSHPLYAKENSPVMTCNTTHVFNGIPQYSWTNVAGDVIATGQTLVTTETFPGEATYYCVAADDDGHSTHSFPVVLEYKLPPVYTFSPAPDTCMRLISNPQMSMDQAENLCSANYSDSSLAVMYSQKQFDDLTDIMADIQADTASIWIKNVWGGDGYLWNSARTPINHTNFHSDTDLAFTDPKCLALDNSEDGQYRLKETSDCSQAFFVLCQYACDSDEGSIATVSKTPDNLVYDTRGSINISCVPPGFTPQTVTWFNAGTKQLIVSSATTPYESPTYSNTFSLTCVAEGEDGQMVMSTSMILTYIGVPFIESTPVPSVSAYPTGTIATLVCHINNDPGILTFGWMMNGIALNLNNTQTVEIDHRGEDLPGNYLLEQWQCRSEMHFGLSDWCPIYNLSFYPGPGRPEVTRKGPKWVPYNSTLVTFTCQNTTVLAGSVKQYVWFVDDVEVPELVDETIKVNSPSIGTVSYACKLEDYDGWSIVSPSLSHIYTVPEMCIPNPCLNQGECYARSFNQSACICVRGFEGDICQTTTVIKIAKSYDANNVTVSTTAMDDIISGVNTDMLSNLTEDVYERIALSAEAMEIYSERLLGHLHDHDAAHNLTTDTVNTCGAIMDHLNEMDCEHSDVEMCDPHMVQSVISNVENAIVQIATSFIQSTPSNNVTSQDNGVTSAVTLTRTNMTVSMAPMNSNVTSGVIETAGAKVKMSRSLATMTSRNKWSLVSIQYKRDPYFHQVPQSDVTVDGQVYNLQVVDSQGQTIDVESEDPMELDFEVSGHDTHHLINSSTDIVHSIDLAGKVRAAVVVVELSVSHTQTLQLAAKRDSIPYDNDAEMNLTIDGHGNIHKHQNNDNAFLYKFHNNIISIIMPLPNCSVIYFVSNYTDDALPGSSTVMSSITSHIFYVNYWDPVTFKWNRATSAGGSDTTTTSRGRRRLLTTQDTRQPVVLTDANQEGNVKFTSNIFGSFSVSRFVIVPNMIDFDNVLSNFDTLLADTPQVLALNCCILFVAVLFVIVIRRADKHDQLLWTYLPLVDNDTRDKAMYTLSVHTGINSPSTMTATPYFVIKGDRGMTYKRMLCDGVRQNFVGGTMSNFVVQTPYWLGRLLSIKIWTDGDGDQPDWKLDRIVVQDVTAGDSYVFICQDWLALTRGSGELCHIIPAIQPSTDDFNLDLSIVSKNMLYNDHIWLSVAKRPGYSNFTRVQRFVCAIALLYLAMLTNAMFYPTGSSENDSTSQSTGLKIGPLECGYREVYVGIVSAIVIVIPGFLMTWIFTRRRVKSQCYKIAKPQSRSASLASTSTATTTDSIKENDGDFGDPSTKTTAQMLNEAEPVNYSIVFLKKLFYKYEKQTGEDAMQDGGFGKGMHNKAFSYLNEPQKDFTDFSQDITNDEREAIFRNKQYGNEKDEDQQPFTLPWWFIFIAYGLAAASIATAAILTVFYSLDWGSSTSNQWLMSLFFSTSASTFVIEPIKIFIIAVILSCVFKTFSKRDMSSVAPFDKQKVPEAPPCPVVPPVVEEPDTNSKEMKKRKDNLMLRHRLVGVWKSIGFRITMVVVCGIVALHSDIKMSYYQNAHVKNMIAKDHLEDSLKTESDVYSWLSDRLIPQTIPVSLYNDQAMTSYQTSFAQDQVHYRLGPIRIIQFRVKDTVTCEVRDQLHSYLKSIICLGNYDEDTEEYQDFAGNWTSCANTQCVEPYLYKTGAKWSYSQDGQVAAYGPGGYEELWTDSYLQTMHSLDGLEGSEWMDERSRGIGVEFTVFNPSTRLFTQAKVLIELPSFGSTITTVTVKSARLYPYITVWDYLVLLVHLFFTVLQIIRACMLVSSLIKPEEGQKRYSFINLVTFVDVTLALVAFIVYVIRLVLTSELLERVINDTDKFSSFDTVFVLDQIFVCCMGVCLFIAILMCLLPLSLNYNLYIMKRTVSTASPQLSGFAFLLVFFLVAFAAYFTVARGYVTKNLCSFKDSLTSLLTVVLGHGKFRGIGGETEMANSSGFDFIIFRLMYGAFCFGSAIFMINLAITILSAYITDVKDVCYKNRSMHQGYDPRLNQFMWDNIEQWIRKILFLRNSKNLTIGGNSDQKDSQPPRLPSSISTRQNTSDEFLKKDNFTESC